MALIINADDYLSGGFVNLATPLAVLYAAGGGTLKLGYNDYRLSANINNNNIHIVGEGKPRLADDGNSLVDGSVIKGTVVFRANGCSATNLGVDRGPDVVANIYSNVADNAIVFYGDSSIGFWKDCYVDNVSALIPSGVPFHAFLANGITRFTGDNIEGIGGYHAVVFKLTKSNLTNIIGRKSTVSGVYVKSDVLPLGSPSDTISINNVLVLDPNNATQYGLIVHAQTSSMSNIAIENVNVQGSQTGLALVCDLRSSFVNTLKRVAVNNVNISTPSVLGLNVIGGVSGASVSNITIDAPASDKGIDIGSDCYGLRLSNAAVSLRTGNTNPADAIKLQGRVWADTIHCIENMDYSIKRGIKNSLESGYGSLINVWGNVT